MAETALPARIAGLAAPVLPFEALRRPASLGDFEVSPIDPFLTRTHIAYFSMEIAVRPEMPTYAGGLGILAGDTARSCADLELPVVFVTLVSRAGYFRQRLDAEGRQVEEPDWWRPEQWCTPLAAMVAVAIENRPVWIRPWLYVHTCPHGYRIPILLLDTDLDQNGEDERRLTHALYGGDEPYRLKQEIILGIGGIRILRALGFDLHTYHLNEGHAALLTLELLNHWRIPAEVLVPGEPPYDIAEVRARCVFTTHTPVEAGHDRFSYELFERLLPGFVELDTLKKLAGEDRLNMTRLALNLSDYVNGVARRHAETTAHMFPGYRIHAITNGVHVGTWAHAAFVRLYDQYIPHWRHEPERLVRALQLPEDEVWRCHLSARTELFDRVKAATGVVLDPDIPLLGFARRMTGYKRPLLLFEDVERLTAIAARHPFQLVMAGKAHPQDGEGKEAIRELYRLFSRLRGAITCVFLPGYDMALRRSWSPVAMSGSTRRCHRWRPRAPVAGRRWRLRAAERRPFVRQARRDRSAPLCNRPGTMARDDETGDRPYRLILQQPSHDAPLCGRGLSAMIPSVTKGRYNDANDFAAARPRAVERARAGRGAAIGQAHELAHPRGLRAPRSGLGAVLFPGRNGDRDDLPAHRKRRQKGGGGGKNPLRSLAIPARHSGRTGRYAP